MLYRVSRERREIARPSKVLQTSQWTLALSVTPFYIKVVLVGLGGADEFSLKVLVDVVGARCRSRGAAPVAYLVAVWHFIHCVVTLSTKKRASSH